MQFKSDNCARKGARPWSSRFKKWILVQERKDTRVSGKEAELCREHLEGLGAQSWERLPQWSPTPPELERLVHHLTGLWPSLFMEGLWTVIGIHREEGPGEKRSVSSAGRPLPERSSHSWNVDIALLRHVITMADVAR